MGGAGRPGPTYSQGSVEQQQEIQLLNREKRPVQIGRAGRGRHGDASYPRGPITQASAFKAVGRRWPSWIAEARSDLHRRNGHRTVSKEINLTCCCTVPAEQCSVVAFALHFIAGS
jgi:hypothetical protein